MSRINKAELGVILVISKNVSVVPGVSILFVDVTS